MPPWDADALRLCEILRIMPPPKELERLEQRWRTLSEIERMSAQRSALQLSLRQSVHTEWRPLLLATGFALGAAACMTTTLFLSYGPAAGAALAGLACALGAQLSVMWAWDGTLARGMADWREGRRLGKEIRRQAETSRWTPLRSVVPSAAEERARMAPERARISRLGAEVEDLALQVGSAWEELYRRGPRHWAEMGLADQMENLLIAFGPPVRVLQPVPSRPQEWAEWNSALSRPLSEQRRDWCALVAGAVGYRRLQEQRGLTVGGDAMVPPPFERLAIRLQHDRGIPLGRGLHRSAVRADAPSTPPTRPGARHGALPAGSARTWATGALRRVTPPLATIRHGRERR